ncbi:MAG: lysine--tRNA ligase [Desulfobacterales bacterium]|jgi:lysyl-tRNA synthetase, class II|nr:lysine--tRNA ligase [Desulfobacteraceae bacterium]MBT4364397.1 lysine--tRNA ligase [Desulfobacteraceae bacterium]MBT7085707.1 lysine--tRNA ligase [Desulfobacterales bacterium]MBT7696242.1 lysine--tRNA ligase [Desulfobacterales bacterium]
MEKTSDVLQKRRDKLNELASSNVNLFSNDFIVTNTIKDIKRMIEGLSDSISENETVFTIAGRMMAINKFGKSSFIRLRDRTGQMQAYIRKDKVGDEAYNLFKQLDVGDFVGLSGGIFKTKTGEWTLLADEMTLLCKSIRPLPEKFHGLKDPEKRYRKRYLDLLMNEEVRELFIKRSKIIQAIRTFLLKRDYLEVETPMMHPIPGGAEATPFVTHHKALGIDLFLRIAPELYLKRLVVGGFERVFEINRNFRNEGISTRHNPEFTMLEFYQAYATFEDLMDLTEEMFRDVALEVTGSTSVIYQDEEIKFAGKWNRIPLLTSLTEIGGVAENILNDREELLEFASSKGIRVTKKDGSGPESHGKIITKLFDVLVEPMLLQPTFITGYPVEVSPLSRRSDKEPTLTERFELFIAGREIANGFSELNDPVDQKDRFLQQVADRESGDEEAHFMDEDYIEALEYGMPPTAGEGIGIDRLAMLLTDSASIREVILFPHMKPSGKR